MQYYDCWNTLQIALTIDASNLYYKITLAGLAFSLSVVRVVLLYVEILIVIIKLFTVYQYRCNSPMDSIMCVDTQVCVNDL